MIDVAYRYIAKTNFDCDRVDSEANAFDSALAFGAESNIESCRNGRIASGDLTLRAKTEIHATTTI
jgi:hypothetical protein